MGLVDYSSSSSESEAETKPQQAAASKQAAPPRFSGNKVEKLRGADGKIRVTLNETKDESAPSDRPAKRAKTGGGRFSGFNSFLPPPKNAGKPTAFGGASSTAGKASAVAPRPGVHLKTGAAPGFSRDTEDGSGGVTREGDESQKKASDGPTIPEGMKPEDEVKFVGKPLMFKPLSVARKMGKKNGAKPVAKTPSSSTPIAPTSKATASTTTTPQGQPKPAPLPPKKVSLFSLPAAEEPTEQSTTSTYEYETIAPQNTFVPVLQPSTNTAMQPPRTAPWTLSQTTSTSPPPRGVTFSAAETRPRRHRCDPSTSTPSTAPTRSGG